MKFSKGIIIAGFWFSCTALLPGCNKGQQAYETPNGEYHTELHQYGITWTFDRPVKAGQFVTGDWWVEGPVRIVKITPEPGPVAGEAMEFKVNRWNDTSLKNDTSMRNGSMIVDPVQPMEGPTNLAVKGVDLFR